MIRNLAERVTLMPKWTIVVGLWGLLPCVLVFFGFLRYGASQKLPSVLSGLLDPWYLGM